MKKILLTLTFSITLSLVYAQKTYIYCGSLINGISSTAQKGMTIVIDGNKIISVDNGFTQTGGTDKIIDLKDKTVMPGLMDMHVHMEEQTSKNQYLEKFTLNPADYAYRSVVYAEKTLMAGFTTVRDLGGRGVNLSLRNAINAGYVKGPRVYTAGKIISSTGGHADPTNGTCNDLMGDPGPAVG